MKEIQSPGLPDLKGKYALNGREVGIGAREGLF